MEIGIIGAGRMGTTLARLFLGAGHTVRLSNSRGPESLKSLVAELGPGASAGTVAEVVERADVVVLATAWSQTAGAVAALAPWDGKILIDTTNNRIGPRPQDVVDLGGRGSSEVVAELVPGARLVKAFNHQPISSLAQELGGPGKGNRALFVAGDDADAKQLVSGLIRDIGGVPFDTGTLRGGGLLQGTGGGLLSGHGRLLTVEEATALLAEAR
jgi:predicted dinucleotide-binding enzyme